MTCSLVNFCKINKVIREIVSIFFLRSIKNLRLLSTLRRQHASLMQTIVPQIKQTEGSLGTLLHSVQGLLW